ncbi:MAG: type II secretion system F family protein [Calditrichaeota bacterium]|nr:MAG: type II secretion system F family protein [Calditrichota bacterium]
MKSCGCPRRAVTEMQRFKYTAKASPGEVVKGEMPAENEQVLVNRLNMMGLYPLEVSKVNGTKTSVTDRLRVPFRKPARGALVIFTRQLAYMLGAGMTLHTALRFLRNEAIDSPLRNTLDGLVEDLKGGKRFSEALSAWPNVFSPFYVNMVRAGERGGMLELVLEYLAQFLEKEEDVQKQVRTALAYPVLMGFMGLITVSILLTFVVPQIVSMFEDIGQTLPLPTRVLISVSDIFAHHWGIIGAAFAAVVFFLRAQRHKSAFVHKIDRLKLRLPFVGKLTVQAELSQFAQTLGALLAHGVPVQKALEVVIAASKNSVLQTEFRKVARTVREGGKLGTSLRATKTLPNLFGQMIAIAEQTNQLEATLGKLASSLAQEVDRKVEIFTKLLEPAMIMLIGLFVGFIVFAMMLPIFQMDFVLQ